MKKLLILLLLSGCSSTPYFEMGLIYPFPFSTDYWIHPDRPDQCEPPWFDAELGMEWENKMKIGLYHESTVLCGSWNNKPEIYMNGIRASKKWGGL